MEYACRFTVQFTVPVYELFLFTLMPLKKEQGQPQV
ncbi:hypothetical protein SVI_0377 [Shewanella violacea DSS12]|uniref:Uncharacterized protein n=1 Tax=Shewanella violacea (strain JCM 10179 / CIP 106290 / LMG 19151 / DSS12) TaxID=637905 RepID=D4ZEW8_SHEVD|nr:hypothetical protein SVI_0377 [Shewanella violacea DSS12]